MQKFINSMAVFSFVVSSFVVGGGLFLYKNRAEIAEDIKKEAIEAVKELLGTSQLGSVLVEGVEPDVDVTDEALGVETTPPVEVPSVPF